MYAVRLLSCKSKLSQSVSTCFQKYFYMICFTGYLREQAKLAMDNASEEDRSQCHKTFFPSSLTMLQSKLERLPLARFGSEPYVCN